MQSYKIKNTELNLNPVFSIYTKYFIVPYDMANMMKKITVNGGYLTWRQAFDAAVVYWATTSMNFSGVIQKMFSMEGTNGVSCYIPSVSNTVTDKAYRSTEWYTSAGFAALGW